MDLIRHYQEQCEQGLAEADVEQLRIIEALQSVSITLVKTHACAGGWRAFFQKPKPVKGLYIWGGVGIGKTFMMDCFYHCVPFQEKMRFHFHQFMHLIHEELKQLQGKKNPLKIIATKIAAQARLLCFDEFFVSEIVDAMILARLLNELFAQGVCLVATSNVHPDDLYKRGLQRPLFLPAIDLIKAHTEILHVPSVKDYRLRHPKNNTVFYTPHDAKAQQAMEEKFLQLADKEVFLQTEVKVNGRTIPVEKIGKNIIWFDFNVICQVPRSQEDYLALVKQYHTIFISNIPVIPPHAKNMISLFIRLIDVLYDARIRLIFSAADQVDNLYSGGHMMFEYARTCSRLTEMQSAVYK